MLSDVVYQALIADQTHRGETTSTALEHAMFMIGIDPHKGSHTAAAVDHSETVIDTLRVMADDHQREHLLAWATPFTPRTWTIEGATGMGALLAQQLVAAGEHVVDVPSKLSSRVRLLERCRIDKTDPNDARSAAIVAWHNPTLNVVAGLDEHRVVLRLLADRAADAHHLSATCVVVSADRGWHRAIVDRRTSRATPGQCARRRSGRS